MCLAIGGFDPPTPGLWALCASSAPNRYTDGFLSVSLHRIEIPTIVVVIAVTALKIT